MLRWGDYPGGPNLITGVLKSREPFLVIFREKDLREKGESKRYNVADFEDGGRRPKNAGSL